MHALKELERCCKEYSCGAAAGNKNQNLIAFTPTSFMWEEVKDGVEGGKLPQQFASILPKLRSVLTKIITASPSYQELLEPDHIQAVIVKLQLAEDNETATLALFEIAALCHRSDGRGAFINENGPAAITDFMIKYATNLGKFVPVEVSVGHLIMTKSADTPIVPNALRQCLIALGNSAAGLKALAAAGFLEASATLLTLASECGGLCWSWLPSCASNAEKPMDSLSSVLLSAICAVMPYVVSPQAETLFQIMLAAESEMQQHEDGSQVHRELKVILSKFLKQIHAVQTDTSEHSAVVAKIGLRAKCLLDDSAPALYKGCAAPFCLALETTAQKFQLCSGCGAVAYCSHSCQKAHWKAAHKHECKKK